MGALGTTGAARFWEWLTSGPLGPGHRLPVVLLALLMVVALVFPGTAAGGVASVAIVGAAGFALGVRWQPISATYRRIPRFIPRLFATLLVAWFAWDLFADALDHPMGWNTGDWGPHHIMVRSLVDGLRTSGEIPSWVHSVSTGDSPFELYPALTYLLAAGIAMAKGMVDEIPLVLMWMAVLTHALVAIGTTRIALRVAAWPFAVLAGLVAVLDRGTGTSGGSNGVLNWALLHNAVAQALVLIAFVAVLDALARPRLRTSIVIWIATGLATIAHPSGLVLTASAAAALVAVGFLARDIRPTRAVAAAGHLLLGAALGAWVWSPLGARLLAYGVHYGTEPLAPAELLFQVMSRPQPITTFPLVIYVGYAGIAVALWSRRALPTFVAATATLLFLGITDWPYTLFGLSPSPSFARMSVTRFLSLVKPLMFVGAAYLGNVLYQHIKSTWSTASWRDRGVAGAVLLLAMIAMVRAVVPYYYVERWKSRADVHAELPDPKGFTQLVGWARGEMAQRGPDRFGRLMFDGEANYLMHLTAETGLPAFYVGSMPDLFLRERMVVTNPATLLRFNVRWVVKQGGSPLHGDATTEKVFGTYRVREIPYWDGQFARVESGTGSVRVTEMTNQVVRVEVSANAPVLVSLGTGYYPRWRVHHGDRVLPTYAQPAEPNSTAHVVAAWLPPGVSEFRPDGPLPSDGQGLPLSLLALLLATAGAVIWSRRRWRVRVLRKMAKLRRRVRPYHGRIVAVSATVAVVVLVVAGWIRDRAPTRALTLGNALFAGDVEVSVRVPDGKWEPCVYSRLLGGFDCPRDSFIRDSVAALLNDGPPSWKFPSPVIEVVTETQEVEYRIKMSARLAGDYWVASQSGSAHMVVEGQQAPVVLYRQATVNFADQGQRKLTIEGRVGVGMMNLAVVRVDALDPPRRHLRLPPATAPAAATAAAAD